MESAALLSHTQILYLPIEKIVPNPYQPRKFFDRAGLEDLAKSIREYGVMQPVSVRLINGCVYELVAGERRLRASKLAGLTVIPSIIVNISDQESALLAMIENLQRQNLHYIEEAQGFLNLMKDYNFTQEQLAEKIGKNQSTIANKIRILKLGNAVLKFLVENDLSERHARALLRLEDEALQMEVLTNVVRNSLTVKKTEELIERVINRSMYPIKKNGKKIKPYIKDIRIFTNTVKHAIDVMVKSGMNADYIIDETDAGCEIVIGITY